MKYTYDFGDNWQHVITRMTDPKEQVVQCLKVDDRDSPDDFCDCDEINAPEEDSYTPTVEELTKRIQALDLTACPTETDRSV